MKSIYSKVFLNVWRALYHESSPGPTSDRWQFDGVDWVRETYNISTRHYSFHIETHILRHQRGSPRPWSLLVVVERWWRPGQQDALKVTEWRQILDGRDKDVLRWFDRQRVYLDTCYAEDQSSNNEPGGPSGS